MIKLKILLDAKQTLKNGKAFILKCFVKIRILFQKSEPRYLLNTLYIDDIIIFIQLYLK